MKAGHLSEYFTGVAAKNLSAVEADVFRSHQHEFNGVDALKKVFGNEPGKQTFKARFIYLNDHDDEPVADDGFLTWYDARKKHAKRSEHRLYFPTTSVSQCAAEGDVLVLGRRPDGSVLVVIAEAFSTIANQVQWLFGLNDLKHPGFSVREELESEQDRVEFAARFILENIGVVVETHEESFLDAMLAKFGGAFPATTDFSEYSRSTLKDINASDDPDAAVIAWMEREEILFRTLERHLIAERLTKGFNEAVEDFMGFSLSVQNRRKRRVGLALENHLEVVFSQCGIKYARAAVTEIKSKPDFLFPGDAEYRNLNFDPLRLTMLGVKSTCKDRWRQVLTEADRIPRKHLLTLETAISANQTAEMESRGLNLVVPSSLQKSYTDTQRQWLMSVADFSRLVKTRQEA
ncbi:type II restriction endonuclease [Prosthecobacter sp.]|uniref:type II restriction endonuclease n=1 Tax=Prosthecobacter sp. TaxID=1965333 RepID=UPI00378306F3